MQGPRQRTEQASPLWRAPQGLRGLAGLRGDAPSAARGAGDERAGRPCGARNKGDAARIDQVSASQQALVPGYQAPPPPTGTAARPNKRRVYLQPGGAVQSGLAGRVLAFDYLTPVSPTCTAARPHKRRVYLQPGGAVQHGLVASDTCRRRGARYGLGRGDQGIRMGPTQKGRPHCCRGIEPAGDVAATCHPGSWRRGSCRPWRPGRPARSRGRHAGRRWYGRSRKRGRQAASARRRAGRRASCRPS